MSEPLNNDLRASLVAEIRRKLYDEVRKDCAAEFRQQWIRTREMLVDRELREEAKRELWDDAWEIVKEEIKTTCGDDIRNEAVQEIKAEIKDQIWDDLEVELRNEYRAKLEGSIRTELKQEMLGDEEVMEDLREEVKHELIELFLRQEGKTAEPGATDNPDDAQRLREDH